MTAMYEQIMQSTNIHEFIEQLSQSSCARCSLSQHENRVVVYRGNPEAKIMLIGEAPGLVEDQQGLAFVGPAGVLYDRIFATAGIDTNKDVYNGNICKCRPVAPRGSGKQNYTPRVEQKKNCLPYIAKEIELINPKIIILAGLTAARTVLGWGNEVRMGDVAGTFKDLFDSAGQRLAYIIYHPAYVIHAQKSGVDAANRARQAMWEHVTVLRDKIDELEIELTGIDYTCYICDRVFNSTRPKFNGGQFICERCWENKDE